MPTIAGYTTTRILYENSATVVFRAKDPTNGQYVIVKLLKGDHPDNELLIRMRHEFILLSSFDSDRIIKPLGLEKHHNSLALILEDHQETHQILEDALISTVFEVDDLLRISIEISMALEVVHSNKIIYRDLNPSNILISRDKQQIKLIDFNIAAETIENDSHRQKNTLPEGTLPYISPEQTGRLQTPVDHRSDFYSLGVTLFQLATGSLPFETNDPGEIIHSHLAQVPPPADRLNTAIPIQLSAIIGKLLEKSPSKRYQHCYGIIADLKLCLNELQQHGKIREFEPGKEDSSRTLKLSSNLYNREKPLSVLNSRLDRVADGHSCTIFISGPSGVGKSSLVQEFRNKLTRDIAYFIQGRFEPVSSINPYAAIAWSIQQLVRQVLAEKSSTIHLWKRNLLKILEGYGGVLTEIVPELELVIGPQVPLPELCPLEAENRFNNAFSRFFQNACHTGPPLVFFLDDMHLADAASLKLLNHILSSADLSRFMLIGTYRDNEVGVGSNLNSFLMTRESSPTESTEKIILDDLSLDETRFFLEETLQVKKTELKDLAEICYQKTGGNPFYLKQFLYSMNRNGYLFYSITSKCWKWDELKIHNSNLTRNIADLLIQGIENLPESTRGLLQTASCIGTTFSRHILSELHGLSHAKIDNTLKIALDHGFILQSDEETTFGKGHYHFAHDQIRQAIHTLFSTRECKIIRLRTGQFLLRTVPPKLYERRLYEIASHLNCGIEFLETFEEKLSLARVNLDACRKAKRSSDHSSAHAYITTAIYCLPENIWNTDYSLAADLHIEACETAFLCAKHADVEFYFNQVRTHSTDIYDICRVYRIRIRALKAQSLPGKAVNTCREILFRLGVKIPKKPGKAHIYYSLLVSRVRLSRFSLQELRDLPVMTDKKAIIIMGFLHDVGTAAYTSDPYLLPILSEHAIRLTLRFGNSLESSVIGYLTHGFLLCASSGNNIPRAYSFGQLALQLQKTLSNEINSCQPTYIYNCFIGHWHDHIKNTLPDLKTTIQGCLRAGDLDSSANAACSLSFRQFFLGSNLDRTKSEIDLHHTFIERLNQRIPLTRIRIFRQAIANLLDQNSDPTQLMGDYYDEIKELPELAKTGDFTSYCITFIVKMMHAVLFNEYQQALQYSEEARKYLTSLTASVFVPVYYFYDSLARLALFETLTLSQKSSTRVTLAKNQKKMGNWARHAPQNYAHKYSLVEAEWERIRGNSERAMEWYDKAIHQAKEHEYLQEEALAYECAARYYNSRRKNHIARPYMREARYCYQRWGAKAKVRQLDSQEWIIPTREDAISAGSSGTIPMSNTLLPGEGGSRLDMMTVIKASRILNSEVVLDELLKKMMRILLESAGAQRGFLIFRESNEWKIKVRGSIYRSSIVTLTDTAVATQSIASVAIINYVIHAAVDVVLNNACKEGLFTNDSYILEKKPQSVLCMPIIHQSEIFCILYLENNLATGAFPPDRQELLHLLGTQAAISLKNSRLFEELERTLSRMNTEVEKRRNTQLQLLHAEKLSALGRLSASIAHEFGNPLMGVKYLLDDFHKREALDENDKQLLELGLEECERMKKLIQDLQRLNKPSTGKFTRVDIHKIIDNVLLFQKKHFSANRIRLKKEYDHSLPQVDVIVDQITQVLFNLTMNSVDAMIEETGILTVRTKRETDGITIEVSDTGSGIAYEDQERIFEPFYSTKKEEDGTGLGLSISYGIVNYHNGALSFISKPNEGTTFRLFLPAEIETIDGMKTVKTNREGKEEAVRPI